MVDAIEVDQGPAETAPATGCELKDFREVSDKSELFFGCQFGGAECFCLLRERGEDAGLAALIDDAEVEIFHAHAIKCVVET